MTTFVHVSQVPREVLSGTTDSQVHTGQVAREILHNLFFGFELNINTDLAEVWFAPGVFLDFSNPTNRAKFHDGAGGPVFLGLDGSLPTGTPPLIYLTIPWFSPTAQDFFANASGTGAMDLQSVDDKGFGYGIAPTSPTD